MKTIARCLMGALAFAILPAHGGWPAVTQTMKPWVHNWWMASAVDEQGLAAQCDALAEQGFGGFHVIPIYGEKGSKRQWRNYLSESWIDAWNMAARLARSRGLGIDLTMGSGWCFGGPWVTTNDAASSHMCVKRAGPGGHGYMIDPFSATAMSNHVARFWAFAQGGRAERPRAFQQDSYEYYGAKPKHGEDIDAAQLACFRVWHDWCHANGYLTRHQAHGAPSNWLDLYALADIPETELNFFAGGRDILVAKFASSAAHVKGTTLVSSESCTWMDEHFCERPEEIKRILDELFLAGVNHIFYHGFAYSPKDAVWPGWCFYASLEMNPRNPIWREMRALNAYVTRCQSVFQSWQPENDLALVYDPAPYRAKHPGKVMEMTVHKTDWFYGEKIGRLAKELDAAGYAFDYISPRQLKAGLGRKYREIVDPEANERPRVAKRMPWADLGLSAIRGKYEGRTWYFVVNRTAETRVVTSGGAAFDQMDPLTGALETTCELVLTSGASRFVAEPKGNAAFRVDVRDPSAEKEKEVLKCAWRVEGRDVRPNDAGRLAGWETWDEGFSGTRRYETQFDADMTGVGRLDLGEVREIAHVWLNGSDLGTRFMPPYAWKVPQGIVRAKANRLVVEVTNLGANRLRALDRSGYVWKTFTDINIVSRDYKPFNAGSWPIRVSGLIGPVTWGGY